MTATREEVERCIGARLVRSVREIPEGYFFCARESAGLSRRAALVEKLYAGGSRVITS